MRYEADAIWDEFETLTQSALRLTVTLQYSGYRKNAIVKLVLPDAPGEMVVVFAAKSYENVLPWRCQNKLRSSKPSESVQQEHCIDSLMIFRSDWRFRSRTFEWYWNVEYKLVTAFGIRDQRSNHSGAIVPPSCGADRIESPCRATVLSKWRQTGQSPAGSRDASFSRARFYSNIQAPAGLYPSMLNLNNETSSRCNFRVEKVWFESLLFS